MRAESCGVRWNRLLIATGLLATMVSAQTSLALRNVKVGDQVPPFAVKRLDGTTVDKAAYREKVLLLLFVRPERESSLTALKVAQRILRENESSNLAVLAVSTKPGAAEYFTKLAADHDLAFPIALDPDRAMYGAYGLVVSPTTLLIDESGVLRFELPHLPPGYANRLRNHTDLLLSKITQEQHAALGAQTNERKSREQTSSERRLTFARKLLDRRKYALALPVLEKLHSEKKTLDVAVLLGSVHLGLGSVARAAGYLDPLAEKEPCPLSLTLALAHLEIARKNDGKGERYLLDAVELSSPKAPVLFELGRLYERRGDVAKAVKTYREALQEIYGDRP